MFGPKVIGEEAYKVQQQRQKGGSAFGPRVRDDVPATVPTPASVIQQRGGVPQHGERIETTDASISVAQFVKVLDENPAFLDTLYIQELARADGPRRECLLKARAVAIRLNNRPDVVAEIDDLLADMTPKPTAPAGDTGTVNPADLAANKAKRIAEVQALDNFVALKAICNEMGLDVPQSKAAAKKAILKKLNAE